MSPARAPIRFAHQELRWLFEPKDGSSLGQSFARRSPQPGPRNRSSRRSTSSG